MRNAIAPMSDREKALRLALLDSRTELVTLLSYLSPAANQRAVRLMIDIETAAGDLRVEVYKSNLAEVRQIAERVGYACDNCGNGYDANGSPVDCVRCGVAA